MRSVLLFLALSPVVLPAAADSQPANTPAAQAPGALAKPDAPADFSDGLRKLAALGVPDLKDARWVDDSARAVLQLRSTVGNVRSGMFSRSLDVAQSGAWIRDSGAGSGIQVMCAGTPSFLKMNPAGTGITGENEMAQKIRDAHVKKILESLAKAKKADLAGDVDKVIEQLAKAAEEIKKENSEFNWQAVQQMPVNGAALVFAVQIYQHGDTALANKLAAALFKHFPQREQVLNAAISCIADDQYTAAVDAVLLSGDWRKFSEQLQALTKKFPRGWEKKPAVDKLSALVKKQSAGAPKLVAPEGKTLDSATVAALDALLSPKSPALAKTDKSAPVRGKLWVLPAMPAPKDESFGNMIRRSFSGANHEQTAALTQSGIEAIPTLAAAATDETLTLSVKESVSFTWFHGRGSASEKLDELFSSLYRPQTRGEIASALLQGILPGNEYELRRLAPDMLAESALLFYDEHAKDTPEQLIEFYLHEGSSEQKSAALQFLAKTEDSTLAEIFEKQVLESPDFEGRLDDIAAYLKNKGEGAKPFAEKVIAKAKEALADTSIKRSAGYGMDSADGVTHLSKKTLQEVIAKIEMFAGLKSAKDAKAAILNDAGKSAEEKAVALFQLLAEFPKESAYLENLKIAADTSDAKLRQYLLSAGATALNVDEYRSGNRSGKTPEDKKPEPPKPGSEEYKIREKLLADTTPVSENFLAFTNTAQLAAALFEQRDDEIPVYLLTFGARHRVGELILRRAQARLAGKEIPAYPDPTKVTKERLAAVIDTAGKTPLADLKQYIESLPLAEYIVWAQWISTQISPEDAPAYGERFSLPNYDIPMPPALAESAGKFVGIAGDSRLVSKENEPLARELTELLQLKPGDIMDAKRVSAACAKLAENAAKYSGAAVLLSRGSFTGIGISLDVNKVKIEKPKEEAAIFSGHYSFFMLRQSALLFKRGTAKSADAVVCLNGPNGQLLWTLKDGKVTAPEENLDKIGLEGENPFAMITVLTAADAKILTGDENKSADADDESE